MHLARMGFWDQGRAGSSRMPEAGGGSIWRWGLGSHPAVVDEGKREPMPCWVSVSFQLAQWATQGWGGGQKSACHASIGPEFGSQNQLNLKF